LSRVWEALRQAERERSGAEKSASKTAKSSNDQDRREKFRHAHRVPLLVYGSDMDKQPFHEEALTIDANESGCLIALESEVSRGQRLFLTNTTNQAEQECRVVRVGRRLRGKALIGVAFARPTPHFWRPA
jgi:PilZ domain